MISQPSGIEPRFLVRSPWSTAGAPRFWNGVAWDTFDAAKGYTGAQRAAEGLPVPPTPEGYRFGDWVRATDAPPIFPPPLAIGPAMLPWAWEIRRFGGRRTDQWRTFYCGPEDQARRIFEEHRKRLRQGGIALFAPDGSRVACETAPNLRTRW